MVLPDSGKISRVPPYSGTLHRANRISGTGLSPSLVALPSSILLYDWLVTPRPVLHPTKQGPTTPGVQRCKPCIHQVWAVSVSFATTQEISVDVFSSGYLDGSVPPVSLPCAMYSRPDERHFKTFGLPHSATHGSKDVCSSPWLFAAYHGLRRLIAPRHPPQTRLRLTILLQLLSIQRSIKLGIVNVRSPE